MNALQAFGLFAGTFFAYAAVPAAIRTVRAGKHLGTPPDIISAVLLGTVTMYSYLLIAHGFDWVLAVNYAVEAASWTVLLVYWLRSKP